MLILKDLDQLQIREDHIYRGKLCGTTLPLPFTTEANSLYVHFSSDGYLSGKGFEAIYTEAAGT